MGVGSGGSFVNNSETTNTTTNTDQSRGYALADYSQGIGTRIAAGELNNATINVQDPLATLAGRDVTLAAIDANNQVASRVAGAASLAIEKAFDLGQTKTQSTAQSLFSALTAIAPWLLVSLGLGGAIWWGWKERHK